MTKSQGFLNYTGPVDYAKINHLLNDLKHSAGFMNLDKVTGNRVYGLVVECLENIVKYSAKPAVGVQHTESSISVARQKGIIVIKAGNTIEADKADKIILQIDEINNLRNNGLKDMFEKQINKLMGQDESGAGLGLILMKIKSGNEIAYNVTRLEESYSYLELTISVKEYLT
jgi:hypothetical protein